MPGQVARHRGVGAEPRRDDRPHCEPQFQRAAAPPPREAPPQAHAECCDDGRHCQLRDVPLDGLDSPSFVRPEASLTRGSCFSIGRICACRRCQAGLKDQSGGVAVRPSAGPAAAQEQRTAASGLKKEDALAVTTAAAPAPEDSATDGGIKDPASGTDKGEGFGPEEVKTVLSSTPATLEHVTAPEDDDSVDTKAAANGTIPMKNVPSTATPYDEVSAGLGVDRVIADSKEAVPMAEEPAVKEGTVKPEETAQEFSVESNLGAQEALAGDAGQVASVPVLAEQAMAHVEEAPPGVSGPIKEEIKETGDAVHLLAAEEPAEPVAPGEPPELTQPVAPAERAEYSQSAEVVEPVALVASVAPGKPVEELVELARPIKTFDHSNSIALTKEEMAAIFGSSGLP
eukprot:SM000090S24285  [mRNA]  locus=s90:73570:75202:- [translate_table: standard]